MEEELESKIIPLRIDDARKGLGWTKKETADKMGISKQSYYKLVTGKTHLFTKSLRKFAEETGLSIAYLVTGYDVNKDQDAFDSLRADYDMQISNLKSTHLEEIKEKNTIIKEKESQIKALKESIQEKDELIATQRLLIAQLEKQLGSRKGRRSGKKSGDKTENDTQSKAEDKALK